MRKVGIVLVVVGIIMIGITGFNYVTREKVVDVGPLKVYSDKNHPVQWSPIVGALLLVTGIVVVATNKK